MFCSLTNRLCESALKNTYRILQNIINSNPVIAKVYSPGDKVKVVNYLNPKFGKIGERKWSQDNFIMADIHEDKINPNIIKYSLKDTSNNV
jgi:hypothetical protein